ncbi:MAG: hypothetical protein PHG35_02035 [Dehalococcoidales bacterium]|nr:hypothetical protein [Dehalococcoidales bacterium]
MKSWLTPLGVFIVGNLVILFLQLFMPAVDTEQAALASATSNVTSTFWGWGWLMTSGVVRWIIYIVIEILTLWGTGVAVMHSRT